MSGDKKKPETKKENVVKEPELNYGLEDNAVTTDSEKLHPILEKLILKGIAESKAGMGIPHEEMMRRIKLRYPFLK